MPSSDFDLLHNTRQDIQHHLWATPTGQLVMETHFKILRAREELIRLNYEVQKISTHLVDKNIYLCLYEDEITRSNVPLGHQVFMHRMVHGCFDAHHHQHHLKISLLSGFTGSILPGISVKCTCEAPGVASNADREG